MNSEKVKEIKKALECWQESVMLSTDENYISHRVSNREILDYINELESENERLVKEKEETMKAWFEDREGMFWDGVGEGELKGYKQLKQFAEKVAKRLINIKGIKEILDETLKEFISGEVKRED